MPTVDTDQRGLDSAARRTSDTPAERKRVVGRARADHRIRARLRELAEIARVHGAAWRLHVR